jgi:tetratricopeptide (TPR) repeat protein
LLGLGRYEEALAHGEQAVSIHRSMARVPYELRSLATVGSLLSRTGRVNEAIDLLATTLSRCRDVGNPRPTAQVLNALGEAHYELADYEQALACHAEAQDLAERHANDHERREALIGAGAAHAAAGDPERAREAWREAYELCVHTDHPAAARVADRLATLDA